MRYLFVLLLIVSSAAAQDAPRDLVLTSTLDTEGGSMLDVDKGATGLLQRLLKLQTTASVLHTTAHPDDEHAGLLTYLSRGKGVRTALLTLNRGEAGANAIGPELFDALGLIRTEELRLSDRYYSLDDQYYSGALDYGYSKTLEESMRSWDRELVLSEMVRVIRLNRPLVVISRFHGSERDGHGNHQAVGGLTPEAVAAAGDPSRFPNHIAKEGLRPWVTPKLYRGGVREGEWWHVQVDVGAHSPWLGDTYQNFGSYGLSLQRSQTSGRSRARLGPVPYYYERIDTATEEKETSFFDGLDTSLSGVFSITGEEVPEGAVEALGEAQEHVQSAIDNLDAFRPSAITPHLAAGLANVRSVLAMLPARSDAAFMLRIKEQQYMHAITAALGLSCTAMGVPDGTVESGSPWSAPATMGPVVRGQSFRVDVQCVNPSGEHVSDLSISLNDPSGASMEAWHATAHPVQSDPFYRASFDVAVPADAPYAMPYYFRNSVRENHYQFRDYAWQHLPSRPAALEAVVTFQVQHESVTARVQVQTREANLPNGYVKRKLQVVPVLAVSTSPRQRVIVPKPGGNTFDVSVEVISNYSGNISGTLRLVLPDGWSSTPAQREISYTQAGQRAGYTFSVSVPGLGSQQQTISAVASAMGADYAVGYDIIRHAHMETRYLYRPAEVLVNGLEVAIAPNLKVGYVMGVGDDVPSGIQQLGAAVSLLTSEDLASAELSAFDAIVIGTRAYAVRQDLHTYNRRLLDYAYGGGNLIVLYQTQEYVPNDMAPHPAMLPRGAEEVSEEDAPVAILAPEAPVFQGPNRITEADFDGWIEQRGSKFFTEWDAAYTPLIETHDTGQAPQMGAFLTSTYGEGHFTYAALAFHRQLPYGVAGAYRLFANLLSMGN